MNTVIVGINNGVGALRNERSQLLDIFLLPKPIYQQGWTLNRWEKRLWDIAL